MSSLAVSRWLALVFAIVLAVVEALINESRPDGRWQYAPLWIIDYVIVAALLLGFWLNRRRGHEPVLVLAWALGAGVFYMALFVNLDPELASGGAGASDARDTTILGLIALGLAFQVLGLVLAVRAYYRRRRLAEDRLR
jgi:hypothetical protein